MYIGEFVTIVARRLYPVFWLRERTRWSWFLAFNRYLCDLFYSRHFQPQGCSRGTFGGGAGGDVCLNGRGLKRVPGH